MTNTNSFTLPVNLSEAISARWKRDTDGDSWYLCLSLMQTHIEKGQSKQLKKKISLKPETCKSLLKYREYIQDCVNGIKNRTLKSPQKVFLHGNITLKITNFWGQIYTCFWVMGKLEMVQNQDFMLSAPELLELIKLIDKQLCLIHSHIPSLEECILLDGTPPEKTMERTPTNAEIKLIGITTYGWQWLTKELDTFMKITAIESSERFCDPKICLEKAMNKKPSHSKLEYVLNIFSATDYLVIGDRMIDAALAKLIWYNVNLRMSIEDEANKQIACEHENDQKLLPLQKYGKIVLFCISMVDVYSLCEKAIKHYGKNVWNTSMELWLLRLFAAYTKSDNILKDIQNGDIDICYEELFDYIFE